MMAVLRSLAELFEVMPALNTSDVCVGFVGFFLAPFLRFVARDIVLWKVWRRPVARLLFGCGFVWVYWLASCEWLGFGVFGFAYCLSVV